MPLFLLVCLRTLICDTDACFCSGLVFCSGGSVCHVRQTHYSRSMFWFLPGSLRVSNWIHDVHEVWISEARDNRDHRLEINCNDPCSLISFLWFFSSAALSVCVYSTQMSLYVPVICHLLPSFSGAGQDTEQPSAVLIKQQRCTRYAGLSGSWQHIREPVVDSLQPC